MGMFTHWDKQGKEHEGFSKKYGNELPQQSLISSMGTNPKETETNVSNRLLPSSVHCTTISSHYGKETIQMSVDTGDKCLTIGTLILFSHKNYKILPLTATQIYLKSLCEAK